MGNSDKHSCMTESKGGNGEGRGDSIPQYETRDLQRDNNGTTTTWVDDGGSRTARVMTVSADKLNQRKQWELGGGESRAAGTKAKLTEARETTGARRRRRNNFVMVATLRGPGYLYEGQERRTRWGLYNVGGSYSHRTSEAGVTSAASMEQTVEGKRTGRTSGVGWLEKRWRACARGWRADGVGPWGREKGRCATERG